MRNLNSIICFNIPLYNIDGVAVIMIPVEALWSTGNVLRLTVHSKNDKGSSERIVIQALSYQDPERRTGEF